jgi:hypothetical protein
LSQLPVKEQKQAVTQNKTSTPQKYPHQPLQHKVQNQVGFYSEQNNIPAARNVSQAPTTQYKDLNEKKAGFAVHSLYALLVILVGTTGYFYAMKVKPAKVEIVEKIVEKTVERVEYVAPPLPEPAPVNYSKIEIEVTVPPLVERKPEKNRFEEDFKVESVRRKYDKLRSDQYLAERAELDAYKARNRPNWYNWGYMQIEHKYDDLKHTLKEKEYNEICQATESAFWCDQASKFSSALKGKRSPANYYQNQSPNYSNPSQPSAPIDNGIDFVGKDVEEI